MSRSRLAWLAIIAVAFGAGLALGRGDRAPAVWRDSDSLSAPRSHLNGIVLASEDVLVFGGLDPARVPDPVLPRGELLDPRTGQLRVVEGEPVPRIDASATTLPAGNVVVAGGSEWIDADWRQSDVTELLDPWSKAWTTGAPLHYARADHGATLLKDGRVLVAGGHQGVRFLSSVEVFDPSRRTWSLVAPLPKPRAQFSIATLPNGNVLVAGGIEQGVPSRTSLVYDVAKNAWRQGPDLTIARVLHATVSLPNGDVLLVGGQNLAAGSAERYDVPNERFVYAGSLARARLLPQAVSLGDGRVIVAGGIEPRATSFAPTPSVEMWDPRRNAWSLGPDMDEGSAFGALVVVDREIWLLAGAGADERALSRVTHLRIPER